MTGPNQTVPQLIFLQADGFSQAYNILDSHPCSPHQAAMIGYPQVVISAFAIELYLKCLICIETGSARRGHSLKKLFEMLSQETQRRICEIWDSEVRPMRDDWWDQLEAHSSPGAAPVPRDLRDALASAEHTFEKVRYIYEKGASSIVFVLSDLPTVLRRVIVEMQPSWRRLRRTVEEYGQVGTTT